MFILEVTDQVFFGWFMAQAHSIAQAFHQQEKNEDP